MWEWAGRIKTTWSWARFAWQLAVFFGLSGLLASVAGSIWAVILGVPTPIALMVGYCTLVGAVYLAMAPLAFRALANPAAIPGVAKVTKSAPDYKTWSHIQSLSISQAAYLWCGLDPNVPSELPEIDMWANVMKDAIKRRELPIALAAWAESDDWQWAVMAPKPETTMKRSDLAKFAKSKGWEPDFLKD
jgi:hypothetical protein